HAAAARGGALPDPQERRLPPGGPGGGVCVRAGLEAARVLHLGDRQRGAPSVSGPGPAGRRRPSRRGVGQGGAGDAAGAAAAEAAKAVWRGRLIAGDLRMLHLTAAGIVERLAAPLGADLFLYGPKPREDLAALGWLTMQPCTKSVKLFAENVTQAMRTLPREEKAALASAMCNVPGNWLGGAPWLPRCAAASIPETSGWAAPVGRVEGSNVFQMFARKQCLGMVAEHEQHARGGRQYETLVYSRSPEPPLAPAAPHAAAAPRVRRGPLRGGREGAQRGRGRLDPRYARR
ncbi:unnamed protein product, partial [Prorocentrum cordatum]